MADDMEFPHDAAITIPDWLVRTVAFAIIKERYLACIAGGLATWILRTDDESGTPVAVIAQQWTDPKLLVLENASFLDLVRDRELPRAYVQYWCQADPDLVFSALQSGSPLPDKYGR
jgi:hypothetical protein